MSSILSMQLPATRQRRARRWPGPVLMVSGALHQLRGRISVLRGTLLHNDILRALGYRQQLVGMLQRFWKRDRRSVEAWVDALLRRNAPPVTRPSWSMHRTAAILPQEN